LAGLIRFALNPAQLSFDSCNGFLPEILQLARAQKKPATAGNFFLCSRQESNLERWYRKPAFYPLNYESKNAEYFILLDKI